MTRTLARFVGVASLVAASLLALVSSGAFANEFPELARFGSLSQIQGAIKRGENLYTLSDKHWSALHLAAGFNEPEVVAFLLELGGFDLEARTSIGRTPLANAAALNSVDVVDLLIEAGADIRTRDSEGQTLLHMVAGNNLFYFPEVFSRLLAAGLDINARDASGTTILHNAVRAVGQSARLETILRAGAEVNISDDDGVSPLALALLRWEPEYIPLLLSFGADPNQRDFNGRSALHFAAMSDYASAVEIQSLLSHGAALDSRDNRGYTALVYAIVNNRSAHIDALIAAGANVLTVDVNGWTVLHHEAAWADESLILEAYMQAGGDIDLMNESYSTPIGIASLVGASGKVISSLAAAGADLDHLQGGPDRTPLIHYAAMNRNSTEPLRALLRLGLSPDERDRFGGSALHAAALYGTPEMIEFLLDVGANGATRDLEGKTAFDLAASNTLVLNSQAYWRLNDARFQPPGP